MAAITDYSTLTAAIIAYAERSGDSVYTGQTDTFIGLAEAFFNRYLGGAYQLMKVSTIATTSGVGTLPTDFSVMRSVSYSPYGPLKETSYDAIKFLNPLGAGGTPYHYAILGTSIYIDRVASITLDIAYLADLVGLSGSNATNWLLTQAPDAYLFECLAQGEAFLGNLNAAAALEARATDALDQVMSQANLAQYGRAEMTIRGVAP